jgi:hypothetical protein
MTTPPSPSFEDIILSSYGSADPRLLGGLDHSSDRASGLITLIELAVAALGSPRDLARTLADLELLDRGEAAVVALVWLDGIQSESPEVVAEAVALLATDRRLVTNLAATASEIDELLFLAVLAGQDYDAAAAQLAFAHLGLGQVDRTVSLLAGLLAAASLSEARRWSWLGRHYESRRYLRRLAHLLASCR